MPRRQSACPGLWALSDARNDAALARALARLPRGSGLVFRHYHLDHAARRHRFARLARLSRRRGQAIVLAGSARAARRWHADGAYGSPRTLASGPAMLRLVTAHSLRELALAHRARADAIVLSPVFATRSHPGARTLGPLRFRLIARHAQVPVIALGGMTAKRAKRLQWQKWAAIDGICGERNRRIPKDS